MDSRPALRSTSTLAIAGRYLLAEQLGKGSMGNVYRSFDRLTGEYVALKRVPAALDSRPSATNSTAVDAITDPHLALAREFQTLATIRHPHIIAVRDYGFSQGRPYFTMDLLEESESIIDIAQQLAIATNLQLIVQLLQALRYLHRRGLIHRDIKPGNVLVYRGAVQVVDLGLSVEIDEATGTVGTLNYMAPEVLFGRPSGPPADLYAAGILIYQMFTGRHPFKRNGGSIIQRILSEPADLADPAIPEQLRPILSRLLTKQVEERYQRAGDVLRDLHPILGEAVVVETVATRESFLQAARFVGRDEELQRLTSALARMYEGQGSAWLVAGESGVGKSRLLDEVRIRALTSDALVLRTQAIETAGQPYATWQAAIRRLALVAEMNDLEASVLKFVVPDLTMLLDREINDAPPLRPDAAHARLQTAVRNLFRRQALLQPLVLLVEDLQWAGQESLLLLRNLAHLANNIPLLILATIRDDEGAEIVAQLPQLKLIKLQRLSRAAISELSESMIGQAGQQPEVVRLLQQETEGNPLFLVEVVRALAEEAGRLDQIGRWPLPASILTGGLQRLVMRRVNIVPAADRELLHFAAVAGKTIDPRLLAQAFPQRDIDSWITTCVNASLLTFDDERLHFSHQKIREGILTSLSPEERRQLHGQVAQALGQAYPDFMLYAAQLAHHWYKSGDGAKAALYAAIAGDQALRVGVYTEARQLYELAIDALAQMPPATENHEQLIDTTVRLGRIAALMPGSKLPNYLQRALDAATELGDDARLAAVYGSIGTFHYVAGRIPQAFNYFGRAMVLGEKLGQERLLLQPYNMMGRALCAVGKFRQAATMLSDGIELARGLDETLLLAGSLPYYAATFAFLGQYEKARPHASEALARARALGHQGQLAATLVTLGHYHTFCGQFEQGIDYLQELLLMRNDSLRPQVRYEAHGCLGYIHFHYGEHELAFEHLNICLQLAAQSNELTIYLPIFQSVMAELMLENGEQEGALQLSEEALLLAEKTQQPMAQGLVRQTMAKILMKAPDPNWLLCIELLEQTRLLFEQNQIMPLAAMAAFESGKLYLAKGDRLVAQQYLGHAEQAFATMGMNWHRAKAKLFAA